MLVLKSNSYSPHVNIATEEYLFNQFKDENIIFIYNNSDSIIVGKHQNSFSEVNYPYITHNNIPVIRRLSGGGTVYHDEGNINITFIFNKEKDELPNFSIMADPLIKFLQEYGVDLEKSDRNDLRWRGKKFSGNAIHVSRNRILTHNTILVDSDLKKLSLGLKGELDQYEDKSIPSVRSEVTNIKDALNTPCNALTLMNEIYDYIQKQDYEGFTLSQKDLDRINQLVYSKYATWEWNYGYSPTFTYHTFLNQAPIKVKVKHGIILNITYNELPEDQVTYPDLKKLIDTRFDPIKLKTITENITH